MESVWYLQMEVRAWQAGQARLPYDAVSLNYRQKSGIWIALILTVVAMLYGASVLFGGE